jgi:uncharacterized cupin superfamily protein
MTNWKKIFENAGEGTVVGFAQGQVKSHDFRNTCSDARRLLAEVGTDTARVLARKAVSRRNLLV